MNCTTRTNVTNMVPHYNDCHRMFIFQHGLWLAGGWAVMLENCCSLKATFTQNYVSDQFLVHSPRNSVFRFSPSPFAGQHRHTCFHYAANTCSLINTHIDILLCIVLVIMVRIAGSYAPWDDFPCQCYCGASFIYIYILYIHNSCHGYFQYKIKHLIAESCQICHNLDIVLKYNTCLISTSASIPGIFQTDSIISPLTMMVSSMESYVCVELQTLISIKIVWGIMTCLAFVNEHQTVIIFQIALLITEINVQLMS